MLRLNREELAERRRDRLAKLKTLLDLRTLFAKQAQHQPRAELLKLLARIDAQLECSVLDSAEYAAMARAEIRLWNS